MHQQRCFATYAAAADSLATMPDMLAKGNVTKACQESAVTELINCFTDGPPSSLEIMTGCCSKACADAVARVSCLQLQIPS